MTSHRLGFIFGTLSALLVHHVHADTPYPIISYECSSRENVLNIHFEVIYDHPVGGYHDSALNGVYDMSKYVRTKIIGGRYI